MTSRQSRRRLYVIGAALLVAALVGGRWLAVETAERAWDQTFTGGATIIAARNLARMLQALAAAVSITWITGNLLIVYRAIGSVQMPRRLGDLEIVEAVPQHTLLAATVLLGVVLGTLLSLGTGDWWRHAVLASSPLRFGVTEPVLHHDVGYYLGVLPWLAALQNRALLLAVTALSVVALLYAVIGSLRVRRGRIRASSYARRHVGVLLASLALVIAWGGLLDPAEVVAGLHGIADQAALTVRLPGAIAVVAVAFVTALISLVWAWRDRPKLIIAGWAALFVTLTAAYFVIPGVVRASSSGDSPELARRRATLERVAFGLATIDSGVPPVFASGEAALRGVPLWDPAHVGEALGVPAAAVALRGSDAAPAWLVAPTTPTGPIRLALETDSGLAVTGLPAADPRVLFAPGLETASPIVTSLDSAPPGRVAGVPITGAWRRFAIAWTIQAWGLLSSESTHVLVWRRDVADRLQRLAPFARFGEPTPAIRDGALWWVSWGYVSREVFPLARPLAWRDGATEVRYARAGLIGAVRAGTGETHLWLAPGDDSLSATWARHFEPLVEPVSRLPADLRAQLAVPAETFALAVSQLVRASNDSAGAPGWAVRPREPFQLSAPPGMLWTGVGLETAGLAPKRFVGLFAGALTDRGPELHLWRAPSSADAVQRLPGELVGSTSLRPGELRIWPAGSSLVTAQAQFYDPLGARAPSAPRVAEVYVTYDGRSGRGLTARAALKGGEQIVTDTTLAARWDRARRLAARADSALSAGDLEAFGRLWRALMSELAPLERRR
ncbi:MAG TPA: UPF0182 family protein [Gemmatimonadales bacterium]|nr:UPF0182 family protein [Gemmatimonadales bacterium]